MNLTISGVPERTSLHPPQPASLFRARFLRQSSEGCRCQSRTPSYESVCLPPHPRHTRGRRPRLYRGAVILSLLLLAGCSSRTVVLSPKDVGGSEGVQRPIMLRSMELEPDASALVTVQTFPVGAFNDEDFATLRGSLNETTSTLRAAGASTQRAPLRLHVVIRRYLLAHSNSGGAILSCVAWAAEVDGQVIYTEQFYATAVTFLMGTTGGQKTDVNTRIVQRIVSRAVLLSRDTSRPPDTSTERTYDTFEDALKDLPRRLTSVAPTGKRVYATSGSVPWAWAKPSTDIDWSGKIAAKQ